MTRQPHQVKELLYGLIISGGGGQWSTDGYRYIPVLGLDENEICVFSDFHHHNGQFHGFINFIEPLRFEKMAKMIKELSFYHVYLWNKEEIMKGYYRFRTHQSSSPYLCFQS